MSNRYRDSMDRLHFTQEQKQEMVNRLMEAGPVSSVRRPLRFRRFAAVGATAALALSLGVAGATGALGSAGDAFAGLFGGGPAETEIIDQIGYPIGASATSNGVTITADAIMGDTYSYAIVYSIRRDDGSPWSATRRWRPEPNGMACSPEIPQLRHSGAHIRRRGARLLLVL